MLQQSPEPVQQQQQQRPRTRLSEGIRRSRVYADGTIHYGMLTTIGEPSNLADTFSDSNWKRVMDAEFDALVRNKSWHLKAQMSLIANEFIKLRGKYMGV
jgi:hypothetical protein